MSTNKNDEIKQRFVNGLKACMKNKTIDTITVGEIITHSGLSRQTFYRHFLDKYDLMNWHFDQLLMKSFAEMGKGETIFDGLVKKLSFVKQERLFFEAGFRSDSQNSLQQHDFEMILNFYKQLIESKTDQIVDNLYSSLEMYCQGSIYFTVKWVKDGMGDDVETVAKQLVDAIPNNVYQQFKSIGVLV